MDPEHTNKGQRGRHLLGRRRDSRVVLGRMFAPVVRDYVRHEGRSSPHGLQEIAAVFDVSEEELIDLLHAGLRDVDRSGPPSADSSSRSESWAIQAMLRDARPPQADGIKLLWIAAKLFDLEAQSCTWAAAEMLHRSRWDMACPPCRAEYRRDRQEPPRWPGEDVAFAPSEDGVKLLEGCILAATRLPSIRHEEELWDAVEAVGAVWPDLGAGVILTAEGEPHELLVETSSDSYLISVRARVK